MQGVLTLYSTFWSNLSKNFSFGGPIPLSLHQWGWNLAWRTLVPSSVPSLVGLGYHHVKYGWAQISPAAGAAKNVDFFVCLSICLFVRHAFERQRLCTQFCHEGVGVQIRFWCRCSCAPYSTFSDCCQLATPLNAEVQKTAKIGIFAPRGRQNKPIEMKLGT